MPLLYDVYVDDGNLYGGYAGEEVQLKLWRLAYNCFRQVLIYFALMFYISVVVKNNTVYIDIPILKTVI